MSFATLSPTSIFLQNQQALSKAAQITPSAFIGIALMNSSASSK
uniref:Uncharacterized protein n=1 Tax=Rhizophora mucronata TaxID=61149 RepID=A0A2P2PS88_RHIMU